MTPEEFQAKFGCTPDEYAERMAVKMKGVLGRKDAEQDAELIKASLGRLREELDRHFRHALSEGIVKEWVLTVHSNGDCNLKVVSVKEYADMFRKRGFQVEER